MRVTAILVEEHDTILRCLDVLETTANRVATGGSFSADHLEGLVLFIQRFADACHHAKEEQVLFPALVEAGMPADGGPIAVMLAEHEEGRRLVRNLAELGPKVEGSDRAREEWSNTAFAFAGLLRDHIAKENNVLYPMGESLLPPDTDDRLLPLYERFEGDALAAGEKSELLALLDRLASAVASR